jgi:hypothetical protein
MVCAAPRVCAFVAGIALLVKVSGPILAAETFWAGRSAGFAVQWSDDDVSARAVASRETVFSARAQAERQVATADAKERNQHTAPCQFRRQLRLLSLVGPYLGFEERNYNSCQGWAHPAEESRFRSVDLRRLAASRQPDDDSADVSLTAFFSAADLAKALRNDPVIRRSVHDELPHDLPGLLTQLSIEAHPPEGTCFSIPADLLNRFVFYDLRRGQAAIRLSLPGLGPCRAKLTELILVLPLRPEHRAMFAAAKRREAGILMIDADRLLGRFQTSISINYRDAP